MNSEKVLTIDKSNEYSMKLVSIIVPVYGVEQYLDKCIESIIHQTYQNLEIILVDDGSKDNCPLMCDRWALKDTRIKVIHKENGGLSDARNAGMAIATGDYVSFVDSDDWIAPEFVEILVNGIQDGDIATCGILMVNDACEVLRTLDDVDFELDALSAMKRLIHEDGFRQTVWNKLYKRELIAEESFAVGKCNEDDFWTYKIVGKSQMIKCCPAALYYYRQRQGSIMNTVYSRKRLDGVEARMLRYLYNVVHFPRLMDDEKRSFLGTVLYAAQQIDKIEDEQERNYCVGEIEKYFEFWKEAPGIYKATSFKQKMWMKMAKKSLWKTARLRNKLGIGE